MALNVGTLAQLRPVEKPASGMDRLAKVLQTQSLIQNNQAQQREFSAQDKATADAEQIRALIEQYDGDVTRALPEINKLNPQAGASLAKIYGDIENTRSEISTREGNLTETRRKNLADELLGKEKWNWEKSKPTEVSAGATLVPPDQALPYTSPTKPNEPSPFQSKEIFDPKGGPTPAFANFNPDKGTYHDPNTGAVIPNARPYERPQDPAIAALREVQTTLAKMQVEGMGLTPGQRANEINSLRNSWTKATAPVLERRTAIAKVESGLKALDQGNLRDSTQILITAFNKMLDEISVVREGEYLRTAEGQALRDRIAGSIQQLQLGGSNLTADNLRQLGETAKQLAADVEAVHGEELANVREAMERTLDDYKIPHDRVFGSSVLGRRNKPASPGAASGGWRIIQ